jgi:hypothetical protein
MNSIDQHATGLRRAIGIGLLLFLIAAPAQANRIVQVRVGNHPTFTRLVFELDAFAGYQVERRAETDGAEQLTVTLEASTPPREITSKSVGIESVQIAEGVDQAIAQIRLRKSGLQMKEMILSNPPRIVLDFVHSAAAVAELTGDPYAKPAPAEPKPAIANVVEPKPEPKPAIAKVVEPKPEPKPAIAKVVEPKPEPKPAIAKVVEPKPAPKPKPKPAIAKVVEPRPEPVSVPVEPTPAPQDAPVDPAPSLEEVGAIDLAQGSEASESSADAKANPRASWRESVPGAHKKGELKPPTDSTADSPSEEIAGADGADEQIADAADADVDAPLGSPGRAATPSASDQQPRMPSPADVSRRIEKPKAADSGLPFNTVTLAGIALGVLIVLVVAVRLFRKRSLPNDLDVTTFADSPDDDAVALDGETSDRMPAEGFSMDDSPTDDSAPQVEDSAPQVEDSETQLEEPETQLDEPETRVEEQDTAAYSLSEVAAEAIEPETGLYDEDSEGEKPMDMETSNLPTDRDDLGVPPAAVMGGVDDNMSQLVQELAGRIANLETRLDEANDSRERLERQVAAQSEELRVQRAAIARTQRALRSLSRSEEDQATEPALREPSQPAG